MINIVLLILTQICAGCATGGVGSIAVDMLAAKGFQVVALIGKSDQHDYLKALGFVSIAHAWIKVLEVSFKDYDSNKGFYEDKIQTAKFYFKRVLPRMENHFKTAATGSEYIMDFNFK